MNVSLSDLTPVAQDYLKVIWSAGEWAEAPVTSKMIAERVRVGASTVSENVRRLVEHNLVSHAPYGAVELTHSGRRLAVQMVRRHRLIETYLVESLGYGWDEVHDEAEVIEHAVSNTFVDRIDALLGHPHRDPHGDPIPSVDGEVSRPQAVSLLDLSVGEAGRIARFADADPDNLRYFGTLHLALDSRVRVTEHLKHAGVMSITVDRAAAPVIIGARAAQAIWVVRERCSGMDAAATDEVDDVGSERESGATRPLGPRG